MLVHVPFRVACSILLLAGLASTRTQESRPQPKTHAALSGCLVLAVTSEQSVPAGTGLAVSADGRFLAQVVHTSRGAELKLRQRDTGEERRATLEPSPLPPGVTWRVAELAFSPAADLLVVSSTGAVWVLAPDTARVRYRINVDREQQIYPGQLSVAGGQLAVVFWPPESYLAYAKPKQPVEVRIYDAPSGQLLRRISLALETPDQWSELALSPDAARIAVLMRATRWPGKARLAVFASDTAKLLWQRKVGAEDVAWSTDGRELLTLGGQLAWLDAGTGKKSREAEKNVRFSEFQKLRVSEKSNAVVGHFARYNPLKRTISVNDRRDAQLVLWRVDTGKAVCEARLDQATRVDAWLTSRGELVALEETYEVRPPLRLLRAARIVTYRLQKP